MHPTERSVHSLPNERHLAMRGLSENLQSVKKNSFFIDWLDPLDLSKRKKLLDM